MTLVLATSFCPGLAIMTTDSREVMARYYYDETVKDYVPDETEYFEKVEGEALKALFLSDYVMIGVGGIADTCRFILKRMEKMIKKGDDLIACQKKLNNLIQEARSKTKAIPHLAHLNKEENVMIVLNGFCKDGSPGFVSFVSGPGAKAEFQETEFFQTAWRMVAPMKEYYSLGSELTDFEELNGPQALNQALALHAKISAKDPLKVSSDCHYFIITRDEFSGEVKHTKGTFDTAQWHDRFKNGAL